jgi:hypothetical protein
MDNVHKCDCYAFCPVLRESEVVHIRNGVRCNSCVLTYFWRTVFTDIMKIHSYNKSTTTAPCLDVRNTLRIEETSV